MGTPTPKTYVNWSGGKDACLALYRARASDEHGIEALLTTANRPYRRVTQHGVRMDLVRAQAEAIGLDLRLAWMPENPSMATYSERMSRTLESLREEEFGRAVFGDIFLEDVRSYREERLTEAGLEPWFPLWGKPTEDLARAFVGAGFRAVVVCLNESYLDPKHLGREYDEAFLSNLPPEVDPCGENGEFHTFVYDGPLFAEPVEFERGEQVCRTYDPPEESSGDAPACGADDDPYDARFWYQDLTPGATSSSAD